LGTWCFRAQLGGNYDRTCVHARAAAGGGRQATAPAPVPVPGSGLGLGLGSGSGSLPGLVLFELGLMGMGCSATRTKPAPLRIRTACQRMSETVCAVGRLDRTVATVLSEPLQLLGFSGRLYPSRSAINSAPVSLSQTHQKTNNSLFISEF